MYHVRLRRHGSTWNYFIENDRGGGSGSSYSGPRHIAIGRAVRSLSIGTPYTLTVNGRALPNQVRGSETVRVWSSPCR